MYNMVYRGQLIGGGLTNSGLSHVAHTLAIPVEHRFKNNSNYWKHSQCIGGKRSKGKRVEQPT